jgi:hypothetical protein
VQGKLFFVGLIFQRTIINFLEIHGTREKKDFPYFIGINFSRIIVSPANLYFLVKKCRNIGVLYLIVFRHEPSRRKRKREKVNSD